MSTEVRYFRVGVFVLVATFLAVGVIVILASLGFGQKDQMEVETYFSASVQGLTVGSRVWMRGVLVGAVDEIQFAENLYEIESENVFPYGRYIVVRMTVDVPKGQMVAYDSPGALIADRVAQGLRMQLASQGITGQKFIQVDFLPPERSPILEVPWKPDRIYIPSTPSALKEVMATLGELSRKLESVDIATMAEDLGVLVHSLREAGEEADLGGLVSRVSTMVDDIDAVATSPHLRASLVQLENTTKSAEHLMATLDEIMAGGSVENLVADLGQSAAALPATLAKMDRTLDSLGSIAETSEPEIEGLLIDLRATVTNLRELTAVGKRYPSSLFFGEAPPHVTPGGDQ